jgi:hypothetical protein
MAFHAQAEAKKVADRYAKGLLRDQLEYEIHAAINLAVADVTGIPPGPAAPPKPVPHRVA